LCFILSGNALLRSIKFTKHPKYFKREKCENPPFQIQKTANSKNHTESIVIFHFSIFLISKVFSFILSGNALLRSIKLKKHQKYFKSQKFKPRHFKFKKPLIQKS
jgi:hypothetical protein